MGSNKPAIDIRITNSVVNGDVVAGDKIEIVINRDALESEQALLEVLRLQNLGDAGSLIRRLISNPTFLELFEGARRAHLSDSVDQAIRDAVTQYDRLGPVEPVIRALTDRVEESRRSRLWDSFVQGATVLLQIIERAPEQSTFGLALADDILKHANETEGTKVAQSVARAYQAVHYFLRYTNGLLAMKIMTRTARYGQVATPAFVYNLVTKNLAVFNDFKLADLALTESIETALGSGDPSVAITTMLSGIGVLEHSHFFLGHLLKVDASDARETVLRAYAVLDEILSRFGTDHQKAVRDARLAKFWLQLEDFAQAEVLGLQAAQRLAASGHSHYAAIALGTVARARAGQGFARVPDPSQIASDDWDGDKLEEVTRELVGRLIEMQMLDLNTQPDLRELVEAAFKDVNPERVLRYCRHLYLSSAPSPLGQKILLHTLGPKQMACRLKGGDVVGPTLDDTFAFFKDQLGCETCASRIQRPDSWRWTVGWARTQAEAHDVPIPD